MYPVTSNLYVNLLGTVSPSLTLVKSTLFLALADAANGVASAIAAAADVWRNARRSEADMASAVRAVVARGDDGSW